MSQIVVSDEQAKIIAETGGVVEIRDRQGNLLGCVAQGVSEEDISLALQSLGSDEPRYTTAQVLTHLMSLETQ